MNTYNVNDVNFRSSELFRSFMEKYPALGYLRIRAYSANEAIPLVGLKVIVSIKYEGNTIIFFEGQTNESGVIESIRLPAPDINPDNLDIPHYLTYDLEVEKEEMNIDKFYKANIYDGIQTVQNINATPQVGLTGVITWL